MIATIKTASIYGIEAHIVEVEVDISSGFPGYQVVGLAEGAAKESKERVKTAIRNSGLEFPKGRITVNLAPAWLKKNESTYDLPIAIALLLASAQISPFQNEDYLILGELALSGKIKPVLGALVAVNAAQEMGFSECLVPLENSREASMVKGIRVRGVPDLNEAIAALSPFTRSLMSGSDVEKSSDPLLTPDEPSRSAKKDLDFSEILGQDKLKRVVEIAVSGNHNLLMIGPAGCGKTMIAQRIPTVMPEMSFEESLETTKIYSISGLSQKTSVLISERPFRSPHHTISEIGLIGGGQGIPRPGEVCLAHNGVLFLDELCEFKKSTLEVLRQPLEDRRVTLSRSMMSVTYPSNFMFVAAMNPCPCGHFGSLHRKCLCSSVHIGRYFRKISGPLLDRIDLQVEVPPVRFQDLFTKSKSEPSLNILSRVMRARETQSLRFRLSFNTTNACMSASAIKRYCELDESAQLLLEKSMKDYGFSARSYGRILKVARTIADMEDSANIQDRHLEEAISYRLLDQFSL
jgi:magnesium chelatase family protein